MPSSIVQRIPQPFPLDIHNKMFPGILLGISPRIYWKISSGISIGIYLKNFPGIISGISPLSFFRNFLRNNDRIFFRNLLRISISSFKQNSFWLSPGILLSSVLEMLPGNFPGIPLGNFPEIFSKIFHISPGFVLKNYSEAPPKVFSGILSKVSQEFLQDFRRDISKEFF